MAGEMFQQMAGQYAPLASGVPFQPSFGFEGTPLGNNPLLGMFLQPVVASMMGKVGMAPMGLNDRNVLDTLQNQRFFRMQQDVQRASAEMDRASWIASMRGVAHMTGTPWGADQMRAARGISDAAVAASPVLTMMAPDLLDDMAGYRGSAAVMSSHMMMAGRYRIDPATGRLGQDAATVGAQAKRLFDDMVVDGGVGATGGLSAGQLGQLYSQLSSRGLLAGAGDPGTAVRSLLRSGDPGFIRQAAGRIGLPNLTSDQADRLTSDQIDKISADPAVADKLRTLDADRVKSSLQSYAKAVNAVRDIFGDMGKPNAPMSELIGALQALTNGSVSQLQPGQLNMMVRMTHQLAQSTGVGLDNALMIQQDAAARAKQMGLEPVFAVAATQGALGYGAAVRSAGLRPAWGAMDADQLTQLDSHLRVNASASRAAQRAGLALRIAERVGGFDPSSEAGQYVAALRSARDTGVETFGPDNRSLNLSQEEFVRVMTSSGKVTAGELNTMMGQRFANREFVQQYDLGEVIRRTQGKTDVEPWLGGHLRAFVQGQLQRSGVDAATARAASAAVGREAAAEIMDIGDADFRDPKRRNELTAAILRRRLSGSRYGAEIDAKLGDRADAFYAGTAESFRGYWDEVTRLSPDFGFMGNSQNMHASMSRDLLRQGSRVVHEQRLNAQLRTELAPLNRGSMVRRAMGYLQNLTEGGADNGDLFRLAATALGGVPTSDLQRTVGDHMLKVNAQRAKLEDLQGRMARETDPGRRAELQKEYDAAIGTLREHVTAVTDSMGKLGVADDALSPADVTRAVNLDARAADLRGQIPAGSDAAAFMRTESGQLYREAARGQGSAAGDVALKLLTSESSVDRFGLAGIKHASTIQDANRELLRLAAMYTGGDVGRLQAGDLGQLKGKEREEVATRVNAQLAARGDAVRAIYDMQQKEGRSWGDHAEMAKALGVAVGDVDAAAKMDPAEVKRAMELKSRIARDASAGRDHSAADKELAKVAGGLGVYERLRERADKATEIERANPAELARGFLGKYGVAAGGGEDDAQLQSLGRLLKSEGGQALYFGLTSGQDYLADVATKAGMKGGKAVERVDAMYKQYQGVLKDPNQAGAFRKQFGLEKDDDYAQFQRAVQLQTETGMIRFGDSGLGSRTDFSVGKAEELLGRKLATGRMGEGGPTKVEFPHGLEVTGRLKLEGAEALLAAQKTGENSAGVNHAATDGGD